MPLPIETFNWSCKTDAVFLKSIRISPQNFVRDRAINASLAMRPTTKVSHDHSHGKMDSHTGSFANISKETFSFPKTAQKYTVWIICVHAKAKY